MVLPTRPGQGGGEKKDSLPVLGPQGLPRVTPSADQESDRDDDLDVLGSVPKQPKANINDFMEPLEKAPILPNKGLPSKPTLPQSMPRLPSRPAPAPAASSAINQEPQPVAKSTAALPTIPLPNLSTPPPVTESFLVDEEQAELLSPQVSEEGDADFDDFSWDEIVEDAPLTDEEGPKIQEVSVEPEEDYDLVAGGPEDFDEAFGFLEDEPVSSSEVPDADPGSELLADEELDRLVGSIVSSSEQTDDGLEQKTEALPEDDIESLLRSFEQEMGLTEESELKPVADSEIDELISSLEEDQSDGWGTEDFGEFLDEMKESSSEASEEEFGYKFPDEPSYDFDSPEEEPSSFEELPEETEEEVFEPPFEEEEIPEDLVPEPVRKGDKGKPKGKGGKKRNPLVAFVAGILTALSRIPILGLPFKLLVPLAGFITVLLCLLPLVLLPLIIFGIAGNGLVEESSAEGPDNSSVTLTDFSYVDGEAKALVTNTGDTVANVVVTFDVLRYAPTFNPASWWDYEKVATCEAEEISVEIDDSAEVSIPCEIDGSGVDVRVFAEAAF